jgi:hypothetical protein
MKKYLSILIGSFIFLFMFAAPGSPVKAAEVQTTNGILYASITKGSTDCGCGTPILGAEKNKIIADILKSDEFKEKKMEAKNEGFLWRGVDGTSVSDLGAYGIGAVFPFYDHNGTLWGFGFLNGHFAFSAPMEME